MASKYEVAFGQMLALAGVPEWKQQFLFAQGLRQYRVDFAWPQAGLLVEIDGGSFIGRGGRGSVVSRTTPVGYHGTIEDYRKRNLANLLGYTLLSYQPGQFTEAIAEIKLWLRVYGNRTAWGTPVKPFEGLPPSELQRHIEGLAELDAQRRRQRQARTRMRARARGGR